MFTDSKVMSFFTDNMILVKLNAEKDTASSNHYYVRAYPTSILINKNGDEVDRLVGTDSADGYVQTFVNYTNGIGTLDDLLGRAEAEADRGLFLKIADKYKYRGKFESTNEWLAKVIAAGDPADSLSGEARMGMAYMLRKAEKFDEAIAEFATIEAEFTETYHGMDAVIYQAICHRYKADTTTAIAEFERYIEKYPESPDVEYATEQIENMKNPPEDSGE